MTNRPAGLRSTRTGLDAKWIALLLGSALLWIGAFGCANGEIRLGDPFDRGQTLEYAQHRYTVLMRWTDFQRAKGFVAREDRDAFIERTKELRDARFTDYESESVELGDDHQTATVRVTYSLYLPHSPYEMHIVETQTWSRQGMGNEWQVHSEFEGLPEIAAR